ncbi:DnaB-like helicase C-terminal domain-containing protein [Ramlibacter sp. AN1133]|uniref:DnaB-like helicase C-terminal domain-containing protein n=1 Tax=Ramlibacter sp. AN1133 TaxID=3133429 RepID=UPI0030BF22F6
MTTEAVVNSAPGASSAAAPTSSGVAAAATQYSDTSERILLACVLRQSNTPLVSRLLALLSNDDFYLDQHKVLWSSVRTLNDNSLPHDPSAVLDYCTSRNLFAGGVEYIVALCNDTLACNADDAATEAAAKRVKSQSLLRRYAAVLRQGLAMCESGGDALQLMGVVEDDIRNIRKMSESHRSGPEHIKGAISSVLDTLQRRMDGEVVGSSVPTGHEDFDRLTDGLQDGDLIVLAARPSMGKAQPLDAKVKTLTGWKRMGEVEVGDRLASVDGAPSQVTGVFPQGERQVFRLTLSDGRSAECCAEHLWQVHYREWAAPRVLSTAAVMRMLARQRYRRRLWITAHTGAFGHTDPLPVDPWVLGALLGDGDLCGETLRFSNVAEDVLQNMRTRVPEGVHLVYAGGCDYRLSNVAPTRKGHQGMVPNPLRAQIERLGLYRVGSSAKFIPAVYLEACREARLELLRGLLDTDGWVETWGSIRFSTCSEQLARDVATLVRSLGGWCSINHKQPHFTSTQGERRVPGLPAFVCNIAHPEPRSLFAMSEKLARAPAERERNKHAVIVSVEPTRTAPCQCIAVSHPSHLYVTDDYVVTHNTAAAMDVAANIADRMGTSQERKVLIFSTEMLKEALARRALARAGRVDLSKLRSGELSGEDISRIAEAAGLLEASGIYIDDTPGLSLPEIRARARAFVAEHGKCVIIVDYLQNVKAPDGVDQRVHVGQVSNGLKLLARELGVPVVALSQLSRGLEQRANKRPVMSDLRESGQIEQDADVIMFLYRDEVYNPDTKEPGICEWIVAKQRDGAIGIVKLGFEKTIGRFYDMGAGSGGHE